jgi:DUF1680 family protein
MVRGGLLPAQSRPAAQRTRPLVYTQGDDEAVVNLFVDGTARFQFNTTSLVLQQQTAYPQTGSIKITVGSDDGRTGNEQSEITISIRIPAWATPTVRINGERLDITQTETDTSSCTAPGRPATRLTSTSA